eukprot:TRINITY_DN48613_c0_g1_i1.p1 TRINITY_DN48613_c0_g1~~TRINITY_DN48613_c0_g1_i1.p1  ORF type:complete len:177 (+),score=27.29 TRINITY_DN48613_c0_g1_i1:40-531(+)
MAIGASLPGPSSILRHRRRNVSLTSLIAGLFAILQVQTFGGSFVSSRQSEVSTARAQGLKISPCCIRSSLVAAAAAGSGVGQEDGRKYADDVMPDVTGAVRLYATHTLCISCLACCCQFKRLLPNVKLEVAFDVWRETRRWVGKGPAGGDMPGKKEEEKQITE